MGQGNAVAGVEMRGERPYQRLGIVELTGEPLADDVAERRLRLAVVDVPADHVLQM